jgi:hypothetical protein
MFVFNVLARNVYLWRTSTRDFLEPPHKHNSITIFFLVALLHLLLISISLNTQTKRPLTENTPSLQMIYLSKISSAEPAQLEIPSITSSPISVPTIFHEVKFEEHPVLDLILNNSSSNYQLASPNDTKYQSVFDPKLRKKLIDSEPMNRPRAIVKQESWTANDGRVYTDMGDGLCLVNNLKTDWRDRGTSYNGVNCGKTDSEKMMDNINADFDVRKSP